MEPIYFNLNMCQQCNGACCKRYAGSYIPDDFKEISAPYIAELLKSGKYAVDWWEGDATGGSLSQTYYLRPRHVDEPAIKGSWGGTCVNFTDGVGCSLIETERPYQCRKLIPNFKYGKADCDTLPEDKADKKECAIAWYDYQSAIKEAMKIYQT